MNFPHGVFGTPKDPDKRPIHRCRCGCVRHKVCGGEAWVCNRGSDCPYYTNQSAPQEKAPVVPVVHPWPPEPAVPDYLKKYVV